MDLVSLLYVHVCFHGECSMLSSFHVVLSRTKTVIYTYFRISIFISYYSMFSNLFVLRSFLSFFLSFSFTLYRIPYLHF
jgi:hypothetical protein